MHLDTMDARAKAAAVEIVNDCAEMGADLMKDMVDRVETGLMKSEVKARKTKSQYFYARYGWVDRFEDYFGYQDRGFTHTSGKRIEGMKALFRSFLVVREEMGRRIKELAR